MLVCCEMRALAFSRSFFFFFFFQDKAETRELLQTLTHSSRLQHAPCKDWDAPPATAHPLSLFHIALVVREGERRLRRNRRWGLDHSRRGGGDRAPRTHLKDALPRATARPVDIQRACGIEAPGFLFLSMFGFVQENLSLSDTPWAHSITLRTEEEEGGVSCFSSRNIQSKSVWFLLNMLLIIAITAAPIVCVSHLKQVAR